jgi:hypothetical protein
MHTHIKVGKKEEGLKALLPKLIQDITSPTSSEIYSWTGFDRIFTQRLILT